MTLLERVTGTFDNFKIVPRESITLNPEVRKMCVQNSCGIRKNLDLSASTGSTRGNSGEIQ